MKSPVDPPSCVYTFTYIHSHKYTFSGHTGHSTAFFTWRFPKNQCIPVFKNCCLHGFSRQTNSIPPQGWKKNDQKYKGIVSHVFSSSVSSTGRHFKAITAWASLWTPWMAFRKGKVSRGDRVSCAGLLLLLGETQLFLQQRAGVIFIPHQALKTICIYHFFYLLSTVTVKKKKWGYQAEASGRVLF